MFDDSIFVFIETIANISLAFLVALGLILGVLLAAIFQKKLW